MNKIKSPQSIKSRSKIHCAVPGCNSSSHEDVSVNFYEFPPKTKIHFLNKWKAVLKIENVTPNMRVCSLHFREDDYRNDVAEEMCLKDDAVPSCHLAPPKKKNHEPGNSKNESKDNGHNNNMGESSLQVLETDEDPFLNNDDSSENQNKHGYFMSICNDEAENSEDPCTQVGACVVDKKGNLMGKGYNCMPKGCENFTWRNRKENPSDNKHFYVCHAELNAITNTIGNINDCTIYVTLFPCNECAKLIIQNGITQVVYLSDKHAAKDSTIASKKMFKAAGVKYDQIDTLV